MTPTSRRAPRRAPAAPPGGRPYPLTNAVCPVHDRPLYFAPADRRLFCPTCAAHRFVRAAVGKGGRP